MIEFRNDKCHHTLGRILILPNFIILGSPKCGTTSLYNYLAQHPEIYMSQVKEPGFFTLEGREIPESHWFETRGAYSFTTLTEYSKLFAEVSSEIAIGETSSAYFASIKATQRIRHYIPDAKLVAVLRNPADRLYSHFNFMVMLGRESQDIHITVADQLALNLQNAESSGDHHNHYYLVHGLYYKHLRRFYKYFLKEKIKVYLFEELRYETKKLLGDLFKFLEVDENFQVDHSTHHNPSGVFRSQSFDWIIRNNPFRPLIEKSLKLELRDTIKSKLNLMNLKPAPPMPPDIRAILIDYYREDILKLQDMVDRDLSDWLK